MVADNNWILKFIATFKVVTFQTAHSARATCAIEIVEVPMEGKNGMRHQTKVAFIVFISCGTKDITGNSVDIGESRLYLD